ncbi:hypothetical protein PVK06_048081 [Gossypium arboreum]|uniref:Uncharacterized protein n=1 Tax=Gossypium arboreum TaxID=29729 RepID=A0ABR0MEZ9_GOSAR|nr:hypothetical protein PVK06_048081 [Gossypium arboreum]
MEGPPHFLDIVEEIPHHQPIKDVSQQRNIQVEVENSEEVELVIPTSMIPRKAQWSGFGFSEKWLTMYLSKRPKSG